MGECSNCRFGLKKYLMEPDSKWLACRRYPPRDGDKPVRPDGWCGEWAKANEGEADGAFERIEGGEDG
jgi:hypothetical protein